MGTDQSAGSRPRARISPPVARWTLLLGVVAAAAITLGPLPETLLDLASEVVAEVLGRRSAVGVRGGTEQVLNVLLFVPLAALSVTAWPRRSAVTAALAWTAVSVAVELTQAVALTGRHPSIRDVALNGAGAVVGSLLGVWARHTRPRARPRRPFRPCDRSSHQPQESPGATSATHSTYSDTYGQPHPRSDVDPPVNS